MSAINQIKVLDTVTHEYAVADLGVKAENVEFDNGSSLEDKFVNFAGATSETAGTSGLVPAPAIADRAKFLKADGTWADPAGGVTSVNNQTGAVVLGASDVGAIASTAKGVASGVAELDANGKVPTAQLPSYVDDVIEGYYNTTDGKFYEESTYTTEITPESGKIYVDLSTNKTYRWGGSAYAEISESLALGETSSTAYRGDRGAAAYTHATDASKLSTAQTSGLYKIATTAEGHIASVTAVQKSDITALGVPAQDTATLADLTDTTVSSPANKEILKYNSTSSKWENKTNYIDLIETLTAGQTTVTFTNNAITSTCRFDIYTEDIFLPVLDVVVDSTNHTVTLTYEEQSSNVRVKLIIYED